MKQLQQDKWCVPLTSKVGIQCQKSRYIRVNTLWLINIVMRGCCSVSLKLAAVLTDSAAQGSPLTVSDWKARLEAAFLPRHSWLSTWKTSGVKRNALNDGWFYFSTMSRSPGCGTISRTEMHSVTTQLYQYDNFFSVFLFCILIRFFPPCLMSENGRK